jgi:glycosyltransferase involved in cell wall biosynthesis
VYTHRGGITDYILAKRVQHEVTGWFLRRFFHAVSANTVHGARCGAELYRLPETTFRVTYNGIDLTLLRPDRPPDDVRRSLGFARTDPIVGTAANLKDWKRIDRLISVLPAIPLPECRLLIVGDGPERQRLEAHARRLGVAERVVFVGRQENVASYLQVMDVFCLPSTGLESFGNAVVEAMGFGLPTVVFADGGGLVEHISDGETGFIVSDQRELIASLTRLLSDAALRQRVGGRARAAVAENYSMRRCAAAHRELYLSALRPTAANR